MNLKKFKAGLLCAFLPLAAMAQNNSFTVTGKVNPTHNGEVVMLVYSKGSKVPVKDSAVVTNGAFTLTGDITTPQVAYIRLGKVQPANSLDLYLSKGQIVITGTDSLKFATVSGNILSADYCRLMEKVRPLIKERAITTNQYVAIPKEEKKGEPAMALIAKITAINKQTTNTIYDFIDQNPTSYVSLDFLMKVAGAIINYDAIMPHFEKLSNELKTTEAGKAFGEKILASRSMQVGSTAKVFESVTPEGKKLNLSDVVSMGKYTLVDFWASWCGPCRKENPNVVNAYTTYHDKGFNILSVSLDTKADAWKAAIAKDGMPWFQVSSLLGYKEPAAELYGVHAIPQNVLLNSKGIVVATNLRGDALLEKLKQLLM